MSSFIPTYDREYAPKLAKRAAGFRHIFGLLERRKATDYLIVETGCSRRHKDWNNDDVGWWGDGCSTILWDRFVQECGGQVHAVNIDPDACNWCRTKVSSNTHITCGDSVKFLWQVVPSQPVDLLYLDSFDIDPNAPIPRLFTILRSSAQFFQS